jgi:hypothetical protein
MILTEICKFTRCLRKHMRMTTWKMDNFKKTIVSGYFLAVSSPTWVFFAGLCLPQEGGGELVCSDTSSFWRCRWVNKWLASSDFTLKRLSHEIDFNNVDKSGAPSGVYWCSNCRPTWCGRPELCYYWLTQNRRCLWLVTHKTALHWYERHAGSSVTKLIG